MIVLAYASLVVLGLCDNIRGPLFPEILKEFGLNQAKGSMFFSFASVMSLGSGYLAQFLLKWKGGVRTLQASLILMGVSQFGIYLSPSLPFLLFSAVLLGVSFGFLGVAQNVLVIEAVPSFETQKWQAGLHAMYGISSLAAPLLVVLIYLVSDSWRSVYFATGVASIFVVLISFGLKIKDQPAELVLPDHTPISVFEKVFFAWILACYIAFELMVSTRLAIFVREVRNMSFEQGTLYTAYFFAFLLIGRVFFVFRSFKISLRRQLLTSLFFATLSLLFGMFVHPIGLALSGLAMAPFYPIMMTAAGSLFPRDLNAVTSYAIALGGITVVVMHSLVGVLSDRSGLQAAFVVGPVLATMAFAMICLYPRFFRRPIP